MSISAHQRIMAISEVDFIRLLPLAVASHNNFSISNGLAELHQDGRLIRITFAPQPMRHIGQLSLPVLAVGIEFDGYDSTEATFFMDNFDRTFHRGGG